MSENQPQARRLGAGTIKMVGVVGLVVVIAMAAVWLRVVKGGSDTTQERATFAARRGP